MKDIPPIGGADKLLQVYGYFPLFHDAEVLRMVFDRGQSDDNSPSIEFTLHTWEMTSDINESGHYILTKHHLVDFRFESVESVKMNYWNHQNVLSELIVKPIQNSDGCALIEIELGASYGIEGSFSAVSGEVLDVRPCNSDGVHVS